MTKFLCIYLKIISSGISMLDAAVLLSLACAKAVSHMSLLAHLQLNCIWLQNAYIIKDFMVACMKMVSIAIDKDKNTIQLPHRLTAWRSTTNADTSYMISIQKRLVNSTSNVGYTFGINRPHKFKLISCFWSVWSISLISLT